MKILIVYASKNGTTKDCVDRLCAKLSGKDVCAVDLGKENADPSGYDMVIFGSSVYFARLRPEARAYLKQYGDVLLQKHLVLFLCCGRKEEYSYYMNKLFPRALREHAFQTVFFGGTFRLEGLSFFERVIVKNMRARLLEESMDNGEYVADLPGVLPENIDSLATHVREKIADCYSR